MKHFVKIEPGAFKTQKPANCRNCSRRINKDEDHFFLEAHWKIKRKSDKLAFCSTKCLIAWARS